MSIDGPTVSLSWIDRSLVLAASAAQVEASNRAAAAGEKAAAELAQINAETQRAKNANEVLYQSEVWVRTVSSHSHPAVRAALSLPYQRNLSRYSSREYTSLEDKRAKDALQTQLDALVSGAPSAEIAEVNWTIEYWSLVNERAATLIRKIFMKRKQELATRRDHGSPASRVGTGVLLLTPISAWFLAQKILGENPIACFLDRLKYGFGDVAIVLFMCCLAFGLAALAHFFASILLTALATLSPQEAERRREFNEQVIELVDQLAEKFGIPISQMKELAAIKGEMDLKNFDEAREIATFNGEVREYSRLCRKYYNSDSLVSEMPIIV